MNGNIFNNRKNKYTYGKEKYFINRSDHFMRIMHP